MIRNIEVLLGGVSAQYGPDAVSGVTDMVLEDGVDGNVSISMGQLFEGDGETLAASVNKDCSLGGGSVVNAAMEVRESVPTGCYGRYPVS